MKKFIVVREDKTWWIRDIKLGLIAVGIGFEFKDRADEIAELMNLESERRLAMRYVVPVLDDSVHTHPDYRPS